MQVDKRYKGIVILGHPRSGTTLLRRLLNGHHNISCPGETHLLSACARFLHSEKTAEGMDMGVLSGLSFAGFEEEDVLEELKKMALGFYTRYAEKKGTQWWAEKTAVDAFFIDEIERVFGDSVYFVGIVRHGLDVAVSCKDFTDATGVYLENFHTYVRQYLQPLEAFSHSWLDVNSNLIAFCERHPENAILCRYEDLVDSPQEILGAILNFIGEPFDHDMITSGLNNLEDLGFSDHKCFQKNKISHASKKRWQGLPQKQISLLANIINPLLMQIGYEPIESSEELSMDEVRRRYQMSLLVHASKQNND